MIDSAADAQSCRYYPFIPDIVMPWMKYFCAKKKITITGTVIKRLPAIIITGLVVVCTENAYNPNASG
jgi:hypothetical protein